jgi:hypothetical protein
MCVLFYTTCGGELLIQIQCTIMRCVRHGLGHTPRKIPGKMGKCDSIGLIGQREFRVWKLPGTSQE